MRTWKNYPSKSNDTVSKNKEITDGDGLFRIEIPLRVFGDDNFMGKLILVKDLRLSRLHPYTIRRIEHLRRTLIPILKRLTTKM
jgi:hypothetical protein